MRVNDQVISNLHAGEIQKILLPESPAKLRKKEGVKLIPPLKRTYTQPPSEEVDVPLLDLDELDDFPDFSDFEAPPPPPETVDLNLDVDVDEESLYQQKVAEEVGAAILEIEGSLDLDEIFGDTDPGDVEGVDFTDKDTGDDNWDEDYNKNNPIEVIKKKKEKEVKIQKSGGQGTVTVKVEPKMIRVLPGRLANTSRTKEGRPTTAPGRGTTNQSATITWDDKAGHGYYVTAIAGREHVNVIIKYNYISDDGLINETKDFSSSVIKRGLPPYSIDRERAMAKAIGKAKIYFRKKYEIEVEEGTV
jgi:hypothetical protein